MFQIDKEFPEFSLEVYLPDKKDVGRFKLNDFKKHWLILFFYPADFTFICPTELADMAKHYQEFKKLDAEIVAISTDTVYTHKGWIETEKLLENVNYPLAADHNAKLAQQLGIYDESNGMAQRAAFIIDPDGILRAADIVSDNIGRNANEILRKLKALKFTRDNPGKVCPASWEEGSATLSPSIKISGKIAQELK